jgi:hypothetical protein
MVLSGSYIKLTPTIDSTVKDKDCHGTWHIVVDTMCCLCLGQCKYC